MRPRLQLGIGRLTVDFEETEEEKAFRVEVRAWLDAHAERRKAGEQSDHSYMPGDGDPDADDRHVAACKEWQRIVFDGGWAGITWPVEAGGRGGPGGVGPVMVADDA